LAPYLTTETADALLAAAAHRTKSEIEQLLAQRFPRADVPTRVQALSAPIPQFEQLAPEPVASTEQPAPGRVGDQLAPEPVGAPPKPKVAPLAPQRFALQLTIGQGTHDKLRYAQALLGHQVPSGNVAEVLDRALDALILKLEKAKFNATKRPRPRQRRAATRRRHIPADVKRTVWERDRGQCTFVSEAGKRCPARTLLEFDHIDPVARGGQATREGMRLRCRAHHQYEAERTFGAGFMSDKRQGAQRAAAARRAATAAEQEEERDVVPWLRRLGFRADEVRRAAAFCETTPAATLEGRLRQALLFLRPRVPCQGVRRAVNSLGTAA
jgi:5-methylcytosine-specific restriction endonuclease McrA